MRNALIVVATALITAACADAPSSPPVASQPTAAPIPVAAPALTSSGSVVSPELRKKAAGVGYFPRTRKGVAVFCRKDADIGTRIPTEKCIGEDQVAEVVARSVEAKENLRKGEMCSSPACSN